MIKIMHLFLCGLFVVMLAGSYVMANDELDYVKQAIAAKASRWHAEESSVSRLSHEERRMKLGLNKAQMPDAPLLAAPASSQATVPPATLDWRNYNGGNWVTPVRDQGQCGSCWAFATTANLESATLIKNNTPGTNLDLSEQVLVSCGGAGSCSGGSPGLASNYIENTGLPVETCYPYTASNGTCSSACSGWQATAYKISGWSYVATTAPTVDAIKNALNTYGPVNTTMEVYSDFFYYSTGVYQYTTGTYEGGHAILIVGYDDGSQSFICKNSWGTGWGEAGFFNIAYSELTSVTQFGEYTIAYQDGSLPPSCSYSIAPTSATSPASGGKGSVTVTAGTGCSWTASAGSAGWITITSGASGSGNGTVAYTVTPNTGTTSRTGSLTIGGQTFTVTQAGQSCTYAISPTSNSLTAAGGSGYVGITCSASGCPWTASSNATWITVTGGTSGSGSGSVGYSVTANTSTTSRTGSLTIGGQTFTVTQAGATPICSVYTTVGGVNLGYTSRQANIPVQASNTCAWSASTNVSWISFISGAGKGNGTVTFSVSTNTGAVRTGTITIGTSTVTINQAGATGVLSVAPTSLAFGTISKGSSSVKTFTVSNVGQADLKVTSITIATLSGSVTSFSQSNTCGTVSPNGSCTISVKFAPGGQGTKSTYLYIYSDGGSAQIALTGTAQ
ncbi:MAG: C1 family peptidase [Syntrophorhabdales bacterium]|jgi:C1A family cysteine protease